MSLLLCVALGWTPVQAQVTDAADDGRAQADLRASIQSAIAKAEATVQQLEDDVLPEAEQVTAFSDANRLVKYVIELDPLNAKAQFLMGRLSLLAGRPREALAYIEAYIGDDQGRNDWLAHKLMGDLYVISYPKLATSQYRRAIELAAQEPDSHAGLAEAYLKLNKPEDAIGSIRTAIRYDKEQTRGSTVRSWPAPSSCRLKVSTMPLVLPVKPYRFWSRRSVSNRVNTRCWLNSRGITSC